MTFMQLEWIPYIKEWACMGKTKKKKKNHFVAFIFLDISSSKNF